MTYDNVKMKVIHHYRSIEEMRLVATKLDRVSETFYNETGTTVIRGSKNGVLFLVSTDYVIISGSLPYLLRESNLDLVEFKEMEMVTKVLSNLLNIPVNTIENGDLFRVDVTVNFIMSKKPKCYFPFLSSRKETDRFIYCNSLYLINTSNKFTFYDKLVQLRKDSKLIPTEYRNKQVLRFETKISRTQLRSISIDAGYQSPKLFMLSDKKFCLELLIHWEKGYHSIEKDKIHYSDLNTIGTPKEFINNLIAIAVEYLGGYEMVKNLILEGTKINPFKHSKYTSRILQMLKLVKNNKQLYKESPLLEELNNKFMKKSKELRLILENA